ncbi:MAG TPA: Fe-S cluster assembly protein HesB [Acidimicrobiaceae bacterium]|nr:Fe-S cluster assembly protein HesB [Acidimicrobiaceae bacterium]
MVRLHLAQNEEADELLSRNPFALLIGLVLDQQVTIEWAFSAPLELSRRLGADLDAGRLAATDPDELASVFSQRPALHRYPGAMAKRVHELSRLIVDEYAGRPQAIWETASSGDELLARVRALPGFGDQKAKIFVAFLGKQMGVCPPGWAEASVPFSDPGSHRSVADIVDDASLRRVRDFKQQMKAAARAGKVDKAPRARTPAAAKNTRSAKATKAVRPPASASQ